MKYFLTLLFYVCVHSVATDTTRNEKVAGNGIIKGNILFLAPVASPSHHIWNRTLMKALAKDGYNMTALSPDVDKETTPNLNYIYMEGVYEQMYGGDEPLDLLSMSSLGPVDNILGFYEWISSACLSLFKTNGYKLLLQYPNDFKFDLIIYDTTMGPCLLPFLDKFPKAPLISVSPFFMPRMAFDYGGNPIFPSYLPFFGLKFSPNMNIFQRAQNLFMNLADIYFMKRMVEKQNVVLREYFGQDMADLSSYGKRSELYLINGHPPMQHPEPLLPNVIQVGGLQIRDPSPLPEDIEQFISSSEKGTVLFSLGTNMKSALLGEKKILMFINAIKRLPQYNFLWKFEEDTLPPALPKNLMVKKWFSQNDILAHPKLKLFLSHTGLLSSQEATWYGIPVLAMPFFGDQPFNTFKLVEDGVAEKLDFFTVTEDIIYNKMKTMLENPKYSQKMKEQSTRFRDRPQRPLDLAVFWCKYLIRNGNAQHLRSPAQEMSHFVQHMWDVLLVFVGIVLAVIFLIRKLICSLSRSRTTIKIKKN